MRDAVSRSAFALCLNRVLLKTCAEWSKIPPERWAEEVYRLPSGDRFRWDYAPYALAMFRSIFDRDTIETSLQLYSRGLKSTVVLLAIGYVIDQAPRRILSLWPSNSNGEKWSKDNLCGELFDCVPRLNYLGSQGGRRTSSNTLLHKIFPGGLIDIFGANAPGDMRRAKGSFLYADEIDAIEGTKTDEGDQLAIFWKRGDEYPDTIRVLASYPSVKGMSRIQSRIDASDGNEWFSTCLHCGGEPFVMKRSHIRYEKDRPETARLECPRCNELLTDRQRYEMASKGFWRPAREFRGKRGFRAGSMLWPHPVDERKYPGGYMQLIAQREIDAQRSENPKRAMRIIINTEDAECFDPTDENEKPPEWKALYDRRENYTVVPAGGLVLTAFVDVQINRLEVEWRAWGKNQESWGLDHVVLDGNTKDTEIWQKSLATELQRKFGHELGGKMELDTCLIDGGWAADYVFAFLRWLSSRTIPGVTGKVRASKGLGQHGHPIIDPRWRTIAKNLKGYHIGTWEAKDLINQRLRMTPGETVPEGYMHWNQRYSEQYFVQLCTGVVTVVYEKGEEVRKFLNEAKSRDEALDLCVGNLAAFRRKLWNFEAKAALLTVEKDKPAKDDAEEEAPRRPAAPARGFVGASGWRI